MAGRGGSIILLRTENSPPGGSISSSEPNTLPPDLKIILVGNPRRPTRSCGRSSVQELVEESWGEKGFSMQVCLLVIVPRCPKTLPRRFQDGPSRRKTEGRSPKTFPRSFQSSKVSTWDCRKYYLHSHQPVGAILGASWGLLGPSWEDLAAMLGGFGIKLAILNAA